MRDILLRCVDPRAASVGLLASCLLLAHERGVHGAVPNDPDPASAPERTPARPEFEAMARALLGSADRMVGTGMMLPIEAALERDLPLEIRIDLRRVLALEELRLGRIERALASIDTAIAEAAELPPTAAIRPQLHLTRALVHLRSAEVQNCIQRHNRDCCIFPLEDGGVHAAADPARLARAEYLEALRLSGATGPIEMLSERQLTAAWLLNITCMALGEYPQSVPEPYRLPATAFESEYDLPPFEDVAPQLGLDSFDLAGGVLVDDFDNDGLLDVVTSTCDVAGPMNGFRNRGDGTFQDMSEAWWLDDQLGGLNIVSGDYDNDGWLDVLVLRGAWMFEAGRMRNSLLRNVGGGSFEDVTRAAGLEHPIAPTQTAAWADFDDDGWLDVYIGNESRAEMEADGSGDYPSNLFRNDRDGTFTEVTQRAGVSNDRLCKGVAVGDYDNDGDMDIYCSNLGRNRLYRNDGDMTFTDVAAELGVEMPVARSFATWFFDYDNDGDLDLWVNAYQARIGDVVRSHLGLSDRGLRPCLYDNRGDGTFADVARQVGLDKAWLAMGASFGDYDNDGWLDVFLGTGDPNYETLVPNVALRNAGGVRFQDVTLSAGLGHLQKGHGTAFADIDDDGDQDIYHQLGGFQPADAFRNALFQNPGHGQHFLTLQLVGVQTNRRAVGSRVELVLETPTGTRELHRAPGCVSSFGSAPGRQEIGLGDATAVRRLEVWWPTSGTRQVFTDVPLDAFVRITEGVGTLEILQGG